MLKYVSKFAMDILPSVAATIIGAYIVNHYIVTKPAADTPAALSAAAQKAASPKAADPKSAAKTDPKTDLKPAAEVAKVPEAGVKAKGVSEKGLLEKTAAERPAMAEKPAEKAADKPAETASIPVETRRHQPAAREKAIAKAVPAPAAAPVIAPPATASADASVAPEEHRDANELARAAIERLRGSAESSPRPLEAAHVPDPARLVATPSVSTLPASPAAVRPLPPPVVVSAPGAGMFDSATGSSPIRPPYSAAAEASADPYRPTPPAEIPLAPISGPLDLHAEVTAPAPRQHTTVAEDMLLAAKSVFHAVLPK
jgi:hypothetical protein